MKYLKRFNESEELGKWWHPHFDNNIEDDFEGNDWEENEEEGLMSGNKDREPLDPEEEAGDLEDCYAMAYDKIDKMLPADPDLQKEFYEIIDSEDEITTKYTEMEEFFVINIDEDRFDSYCKNGNLSISNIN